jgi:hypothetical protein
MKLKNPNLPYILLFVLPFFHIGLGISSLTSDATQGPGAAIVGPVFMITDWIYGMILLWLLLSPSMRWQTRDRGLMVLGMVTIAMWLLPLVPMLTNREGAAAIKGLSLESVGIFLFYSGPLIAYISGRLALRRHPYLRDL